MIQMRLSRQLVKPDHIKTSTESLIMIKNKHPIYNLLGLSLLCMMSACLASPRSSTTAPFPSSATMPYTTDTPVSLLTDTPLSTPPSNTVNLTTTPIITQIQLTLINHCPTPQVIDFAELKISSEQRLLMAKTEDKIGNMSLWSLSRTTVEPFMPVEPRVLRKGISPNGYWLAEVHFDETYSSGTIWLTNFAGEKWEVSNTDLVKSVLDLTWVDNYHLVTWQLTEEVIYGTNLLPTQIFNPFTGEIRSFPPLPEVPFKNNLWVGPNASFVVYVEPSNENRWVLYDYQSQKTEKISPSTGLFELAMTNDGEKIAFFTLSRSSSERIILNLVETKQPKNLYRVEIEPFKFTAYPRWSPNSQYLAFAVYGGDPSNQEDYTDIYILDTQMNKIYSYCSPPKPISPLYWSKDGKYLAWTSDNQGVIILDRITGQFAAIEKMLVIDWGVYKEGLTLQTNP